MRVLALTVAIVILDQWSKLLIRQKYFLGESQLVIPGYLNFTYLRNTGAVWGIFQHQNEWLVLLSIIVLILLAVFYRFLVDDRRVQRLAIACLLGGIVSNLIDRLKSGWVTDFLDFHWGTRHWPAFNLADAAICIGVGIYVVTTLWGSTRGRGRDQLPQQRPGEREAPRGNLLLPKGYKGQEPQDIFAEPCEAKDAISSCGKFTS